MKKPILEIPPEKFYKWGFFIFIFTASMNTLTVFQNLYTMKFLYATQILSAFGSLAFNYLIAGFFYFLWGTTKPSISDEDFEKEILKGGQDDTTKTKSKKGKRRS